MQLAVELNTNYCVSGYDRENSGQNQLIDLIESCSREFRLQFFCIMGQVLKFGSQRWSAKFSLKYETCGYEFFPALFNFVTRHHYNDSQNLEKKSNCRFCHKSTTFCHQWGVQKGHL